MTGTSAFGASPSAPTEGAPLPDRSPLRPARASRERVHVAEVFDGDTVRVVLRGRSENVRLIGIDAPELHKPGELPQFLGDEASTALSDLVLDRDVTLIADPRAGEDKFARRLAYIQAPGGEDVGAQLVSRGLARVFRKYPFARKSKYLALEDDARRAGRGVFKDDGRAELAWVRKKTPDAISVWPTGASLFAVSVLGWVRTGVDSQDLQDTLWTSRRALGLAALSRPDAFALLQEKGFARVP